MKTFKKGQKVEDSWYIELRTGIVKEVLKTRIKIYFPRLKHIVVNTFWPDYKGLITYDRAHYQFLKHPD
jgi:hypothetical protein